MKYETFINIKYRDTHTVLKFTSHYTKVYNKVQTTCTYIPGLNTIFFYLQNVKL